MKPPQLRAIEAFEAFGRHGSVTAAANELGVSPGAVSQKIRKAEEALGVQLLERRGRTVALTSWGRVYHTAISGSFDRIRNAGELLERARVESALTVSCLPSLASNGATVVRLASTSRGRNRTVDWLGARDTLRRRTGGLPHFLRHKKPRLRPLC